MNKYTIYCTSQQTKKALELGAHIETCGYYYKQQCGCNTISDIDLHIIPTTDQLIGWLEDQPPIGCVDVFRLTDGCCEAYWVYDVFARNGDIVDYDENSQLTFSTRKEATLAAIDNALEYLEQSKKQN